MQTQLYTFQNRYGSKMTIRRIVWQLASDVILDLCVLESKLGRKVLTM